MGLALLCLLTQLTAPTIPVKIDPRVELLTAMFRLQGADEFNMSSSKSPYSERLDKFLRPYRKHPAMLKTDWLREERGIGFDAVAWLAVHIDGIRSPKLIPGAHPADWKSTWKKEDVAAYLPLIADFVRDTKFEQFLASEQDYFARATKSLEGLLVRKPVGSWLSDFFGAPPSPSSFAIVGLLCGGGNYGVSFRKQNEEITATPVLGAGEFDGDGLPIYGDNDLGLILHEFSHPYVNHVVAEFPEILKAGEPLFKLTRDSLRRNAYGDAPSTMFETFTRASENIMLQRYAPELAEDNMIGHRVKGFLWQSDVVDALKTASKGKASFRERIGKCVPVMKALAKNPKSLLSRCPLAKDIQVSPADSTGVSTIVVTFDRPMNPKSRGLTISPDGYEVVERTSFDKAGMKATLKVRFKPGAQYEIWVNRFEEGYVSATGYPARAKSWVHKG